MSSTDIASKRIESELNGKESSEITDLNLDNCQFNGQLEGLNESFSSLKNLSMINAGLSSLKGFPKLLKLQKLEVKDNDVDGSLSSLSSCVSLSHINLSGNKIETIEALSPLADLKNIKSLDLRNCEVTKVANYRESVYKLIPSLETLDGCDKNNIQVDAQDENGNGDGKQEQEVEKVGDVKDQEKDGSGAESDEEDEDIESGSGEDEYGLSYLERDDIVEDDEDDGDYEEEEDVDDEEIEDGDEENTAARGEKRKHEEDEDESS